VEAYMRLSGVSDAMMPRIMDTIPPTLWFRAIRATAAHITSSHKDNHVLDFMQEDIPPATTDLNDHNGNSCVSWTGKKYLLFFFLDLVSLICHTFVHDYIKI
jgi:hypothetical protein